MRTPLTSCIFYIILSLCAPIVFTAVPTLDEFKKKENQDFWRHKGQAEIDKELKASLNQNVAKNVILFIGDGMGMTTITAARHLKELKTGVPRLAMETFPHIALSQVRI